MTYEDQLAQQTKDSDMIFTIITNGDFANFHEANDAVVMLFVMDMSVSRSGISHALGRLQKHYKEKAL